ncbi:MAG TPA: cell division protein FtsL [bacterium]|nr:cell division protein FtsL [bacterium]
MKDIYKFGNKVRIEKSEKKEILKKLIMNVLHSWKIFSGFVVGALFFWLLLTAMTIQQESYTNLRAKIRKLQQQKIELDNEKKMVLLEKIELENADRIKSIAAQKLGLVEDINKKVVIIKVEKGVK